MENSIQLGEEQVIKVNRSLVKLRREKKRILLYTISPDDGTIRKMLFVTPMTAIFLYLLDGKRTWGDVSNSFSFIFGVSDKNVVLQYLKNTIELINTMIGEEVFIENRLLVDKDFWSDYDPLDFVIEKDQLDFSSQSLSAPLDINYIVTQKCNRSCIYCYAEKEYSPVFEELSLSRICSIFQEAKSMKINSITLSGGEAFMRPDFVDIVAEAIKANLIPFVSTKSYLSKKKCALLKDSGLQNIQVSIDSPFEKTANMMTGSKGYFNQMIKTIDNLNSVGMRVKAKAVVTSFNVNQVLELIEFLSKKNISWIHFVRYGRSNFRHQDPLFVSNEDLKIAWEKIERYKSVHPEIRVDHNLGDLNVMPREKTREEKERLFNERAVCGVGKFTLTILPDGAAFACEQLPTNDEFIYGDLKKQTISEIWNSKKLADLVKPPREKFVDQPCYTCNDFDECHDKKGRCLRDAYILFGNAYAVDPKCPQAPSTPRQS